jgi:D-arabinose 1-dehydrogenase-like Zn-dependent alcohol dehydrogenase
MHKKNNAHSKFAVFENNSKDEQQMNAAADSFDFVLVTVSGSANASRYVSLLRSNGTLCLLGICCCCLLLLLKSRLNCRFAEATVDGAADTFGV